MVRSQMAEVRAVQDLAIPICLTSVPTVSGRKEVGFIRQETQDFCLVIFVRAGSLHRFTYLWTPGISGDGSHKGASANQVWSVNEPTSQKCQQKFCKGLLPYKPSLKIWKPNHYFTKAFVGAHPHESKDRRWRSPRRYQRRLSMQHSHSQLLAMSLSLIHTCHVGPNARWQWALLALNSKRQAPDRSGHYRHSTARARPDLNSERQITVGTTGGLLSLTCYCSNAIFLLQIITNAFMSFARHQ